MMPPENGRRIGVKDAVWERAERQFQWPVEGVLRDPRPGTPDTAAAPAALVEICQRGWSESARVAAANAILDRGCGNPRRPNRRRDLLPVVTFKMGARDIRPAAEITDVTPTPDERLLPPAVVGGRRCRGLR
jgi:hypothetical protein